MMEVWRKLHAERRTQVQGEPYVGVRFARTSRDPESGFMAIPSLAAKPWYVRKVWPAGIGLLSGVIAALSALVEEVSRQEPSAMQSGALVLVLLSTIGVGVVAVLRSRYEDSRALQRESPEDLRGCLHVMYRMVAGHKGVAEPRDGWLRITIHRVEGHELEQILPYVGTASVKPNGGAGRRFSISTGLIGKVARAGKPQRIERPQDMDFDEWQSWLVEHTGMTAQQAAATRSDRFSFFGIPIPSPEGRVLGVLYLDAAEPNFFASDTVERLTWACVGLSRWIDERYLRR